MVTKEDMGKAPEDRDEFDGRDSGEVIGVDSNIEDQREEMGEEELGEGTAVNSVASIS